jgi:hypothetical protein
MTKTALRQVLAEWLNERQRNLSPENSVHIHVDEVMERLGRRHYHPVLDLVEPYEVVIDLLGDLVNEVIPSLLIPLSTPDDSEMSIRSLLSSPDIQHLEGELIRELPSINLAYRRNHLFPRRGETYSRQLDWQPFRVPRDDVFFYYQIDGVRGVPGYDDDRPFLRSILGKHYPDSLRPRTS